MPHTELLIGLVETLLGRGHKTAKDNYAFNCPFCFHKKPKLEINFKTNEKGDNPWHCWVCEAKGKKLETLFKKLKASSDKLFELRTYVKGKVENAELEQSTKKTVSLPDSFIPLVVKERGTLVERQAINYLASRGIGPEDILKYGIGYCETGRYANRVIIPSYDDSQQLNYFVARAFDKGVTRAYDAPSCDKNEVIGFENLINWNVPVILCEGAFDAIAIKRNVIPLFGKVILNKLKAKLLETRVQTVYIALDNDAIKLSLKYAQELLNVGKEVYLVELQGKDPAEIGFTGFLKLLHTATPLTFKTYLQKKLELS